MESILEELLLESNTNIDKLIDECKEFEHSPYEYLEFLDNVLDNYNFECDFSYLLDIFPIVSFLVCTTEVRKRDRIKMADLLKNIRNKIQILILKKPGDISKENKNFILLKELIDNTESLIIANFYDVINQYQGNSLKLIEYLLFELKDFSLIEDVLKNFPYMIRLRDKNNTSLIQKVVAKYIDEVYLYTDNKELTTNFNLIYYERVINLFLNHEKLELSFKEQKDIISNINYCRKNINLDNYNNLTKRKFIFWLNHLEEKLEDKKHQPTFKEKCYMHDIQVEFDEGILSEARRLNSEIKPSKYPNRKIIDNEFIITIDGDDANELDDALSIEKLESGYYKLGVHIADPTGLLPKNSIILDSAYERGTSIYLPNPIFMFPEILSKDKMNLLENKYRLATSYYLYINENGTIEDYDFFETVIKVSKNTTYNEVNEIINTGNCQNEQYLNTVNLLSHVLGKLKNNFKMDEIYKLVNRTTNNITNTNIIDNNNASKIVETSMMMVNYIVPYHMNKNKLPCINRIHTIDKETRNKITTMSNAISLEDNKTSESLFRYFTSIYPKSIYSTESKGHFGLGLEYYSHVTAPLRRYIDNAMKLYVLDPFYFNHTSDKEAYLIMNKLNEICKHINEKNIIINSFLEKDITDTPKILIKS